MATQRYSQSKTVLDAARERIAFLFDHHAQIICSISGGKDSEVLAHLALCEARARGRKVILFLLDEEAMYQSSVDMAEYLMSLYPENTIRSWLQVPFLLTNATSLTDGQLHAWEPGQHKIWMRPKGPNDQGYIHAKPWDPDKEIALSEHKGDGKGKAALGFYGVIANYETCYEGAAFLVGLRAAGESPNRWRAVTKNPVTVGGQRVYWGTQKRKNTVFYPIYDWLQSDVWRYIHEHGLKYSRIYDYQFKKGFAPSEIRVSSLIHERSFKSICELPEFEPKTYARLCKRIKGIAFAQETGKDAKVFRARTLPKNFKTWRAYRDFLLSTYPDPAKRDTFVKRFARHLDNEYVARQQVRQLCCSDYENNLPVDNRPDPRDELIAYYNSVL